MRRTGRKATGSMEGGGRWNQSDGGHGQGRAAQQGGAAPCCHCGKIRGGPLRRHHRDDANFRGGAGRGCAPERGAPGQALCHEGRIGELRPGVAGCQRRLPVQGGTCRRRGDFRWLCPHCSSCNIISQRSCEDIAFAGFENRSPFVIMLLIDTRISLQFRILCSCSMWKFMASRCRDGTKLCSK